MTSLEVIREALLSVMPEVYHYHALKKKGKYIVWAEDSQGTASWADDVCTYQTIQGTVDYFTREEDDLNVEAIQKALNNGLITWWLNSVQHEEDTGYIHYEWVWEVPNDGAVDNNGL